MTNSNTYICVNTKTIAQNTSRHNRPRSFTLSLIKHYSNILTFWPLLPSIKSRWWFTTKEKLNKHSSFKSTTYFSSRLCLIKADDLNYLYFICVEKPNLPPIVYPHSRHSQIRRQTHKSILSISSFRFFNLNVVIFRI